MFLLTLVCLCVALFILNENCSAFQITGATRGIDPTTGERPARIDIDTFAQSGPQFDLYLLAVRQLQLSDPLELLSYFQISGVHGFPQAPWDGVEGTGTYVGFCTHAAVPFPTWHRPYVALWEQIVSSAALDIAATYPDDMRIQYMEAATVLRVPFWDWAASPSLPEVVIQTQIMVNAPDGPQLIQNPLYCYVFQGNQSLTGVPTGYPLYNMTTTVRWWNPETEQSNQTQANAVLASNAANTLAMVYQLFTTVTNYTTFSCVSPGGQTNSVVNNIESIHNNIHNFVGGNGHMSYPTLSAFDPIFWLHHANVDRIFAMWQVLNPDSYIEPTVNSYGSYYEIRGTVDSGSSVLAPFHSDDGTTMYTSDDVRDISLFGYTYPGLTDWNTTQTELQAQVRSIVNQLYNPGAFSFGNSTTPNEIERDISTGHAFRDVGFNMVEQMAVNNLKHQWSIQTRAPRHTLKEAFAVHFFMGSPPTSVTDWPIARNLVGTHVLNMAGKDSFVNDQHVLQGEVSLTHVLAAAMHRRRIQDLTPDTVVPMLSKYLTWRASTPDGREVNLDDISGLVISVHSRELRPTTELSKFPIYGDLQSHPEATSE